MTLNIIHLAYRFDRYEHLMKELKSQNIDDFKLWDGIINEENVYTGISQAFKQVIRDAKERELPMCCIGEDDLCFTAPRAWQYYLDNIPPYFDIYIASFYSGLTTYDNRINNFSGMTLVTVAWKFYNKFLELPEEKSIDNALDFQGEYFVCPKWPCIQMAGYSDQKKQYVDYVGLTPEHKLFRGH